MVKKLYAVKRRSFSSGFEPRPANWDVPAGSNRSGGGGSQSGDGQLAATYGYDESGTGQMTSLTTSTGTTHWAYDPTTGQLQSETFADGTKDTYAYNDKGQLSSETMPGMTGTFGYDAAGDQLRSSYFDATTGLVQSIVAQQDDQGRAIATVDTDNGKTFTETDAYTSLGDLQSETFGSAGNTTVAYGYYAANTVAGHLGGDADALSSLTASTPGGQAVSQSYAYDSSGRLASITVNGATINYGYASNSNQVETIAASNGNLGVVMDYRPDASDGSRLGDISIEATSADPDGHGDTDNQNVYDASYTYNDDNQRATDQITQTDSDGNTTSQTLNYTYDPTQADALTQVTDGDGNVLYNYGYDATGNFTGNASLGSINSVNEYSNLTYNQRGDLTNDGTYTYGYDALDRLISVTPDSPSSGSTMERYGFDSEGRRLWENVYTWSGSWALSTTYHFVWSGDELIEELDGNNNVLQQYTWGPGANGSEQVIALTDFTGGTPHTDVLVYDASGNVAMMLDPATGEVVANYTYTPYGALVSATGPDAALNPWQGKGQWVDPETPQLGWAQPDTADGTTRLELFTYNFWLQDDPTGINGGLNPHEVDGGDPINYGDPSGTAPVAEAPAAVQPSPVSKSGPLWTPDPPVGTQAAQAFLQGQVAVSMAQAFMGPPGHVPMSEFSFGYWRGVLANNVQNGLLDANQANTLLKNFQVDSTKTVPTYVVSDPVMQKNGRFIIPVQSNAGGGPLQVGAPPPTAQWSAQYQGALAQRKAAAAGGKGNGGPPTTGPATQPSTQPSKNIVNISTAGYTPDEITDLKEYVRRTNQWLAANGGAVVQSTQGALRQAATVAAANERNRAAQAGSPYLPYPQAQVGHVPDTALSGQAVPPGGWLQMRGKSNSVVGGVLGPRVGQRIDGFTVDGSFP